MWFVIIALIFFIIYPYVLYPLILYVIKKEDTPAEETEGSLSVSLYIAAYNEEGIIGEKLDNSLRLKTGNIPFEIVVGSDGSTDKTNEIVANYAYNHKNIRLLSFKERAGKVNVLNRGIPLCKGKIILLSDANAMYNEECLVNLLRNFRNKKVGCVAGEKHIVKNGTMIGDNEGLYWKLESLIKELEAKVETVIGADGACYAIRKELFVLLPSDTSVDDFLLSMKIVEQGYQIAYEPNAFSIEEAGSTMKEELKRKVRIAAGNFYNLKLLTSFMRLDKKSWMFVSHKFLRWISPVLFILLTIVLAVEAFFSVIAGIIFVLLAISYLISYLKFQNIDNIITNNRISNIFSYLYLTVWAQLLGFIKYKRKEQGAVWDTLRQ